MEKVHQVQWVVEDEQEVQDAAALKGRQTLQHPKEHNILNGVGVTPPSPLSPDCDADTNGVCLASVDDEQPLIQKEGGFEDVLANEIVENGSDIAGAVGLGVVAELVGEAATNGEVIDSVTINLAGSQNKDSVYFERQQGNDLNGLTGVQNGGDGATPVLPQCHEVGEVDIQVENSDMQNSLWNEISHQCIETIGDKVPSTSELTPLQTTVENFGDGSSAAAEAGPSPSDTNGGAHSNGACLASVDYEQPLIQKEEEIEERLATDIVENGNHFNSAATNGEIMYSATTTTDVADGSLNKNSVYFDKKQGKWKCHHCSWTKRFESPWNVPLGNLKGYYSSDLLMNIKFKTMIQHGPCFVSETDKGNDFNGRTGVQNDDGAMLVLPKSHGVGETDIQVENSDMQNGLWNGINNQCMKAIDDKVPSKSELSPLQNLSEIQADESSAKAGPNSVKEIDQKLEDFDVEAVLAKQETHDLFCPNCKSCITKRVILKKRKRHNINKNLDTKAKRDKLETEAVKSSAQEDNQSDRAVATSDAGTIEQPTNNDEPEREPEVFRCLSCFSFFIPLRNGIKLFPNFGGAREPESSQTPLITPASDLENTSSVGASKENWFFSLFTSNERKKAHGQDGQLDDRSTSKNIQPTPGQLDDRSTSKNIQPTPDIKTGHGGVVDSPIPSTVKPVKTESQMKSSINSSVMASGNEALADKKFLNSSFQNGSSPIQSPLQNSSDLMNGNVRANVGEKKKDSVDRMKKDTVVADKPLMSFSDDIASNGNTVLSAAVAAAATNTDMHFNLGKTAKDDILKSYEEPLIHDKSQKDVDASVPSGLDFMKAQSDIEEEINLSVGKDKQEALKSPASRTEDNVPNEGAIATQEHTQIDIGEQPRAETSEPQEWEIVKSIVYGGLIESITSLGIVSSAISSGAAPLNIIALGLANLIGGIFIIGHDLIELRNGHSEGDPQQSNMQEDRYQEQLGRRSNFLLHAVLVVLSFLVFGSVPLIVYGIMIRKNYYAQVTIAAVAAISIVCITLLAVGKAYTRRPPKSYTKTMFQYVTMALATSGVSYIVGDLLKNFLEKFNRPESGVALSMMPFSGTASMEPAWMSY